MMNLITRYINTSALAVFTALIVILSGCMSSKKTQYETNNDSDTSSVYHGYENNVSGINKLFATAFEEQNNEMYSPKADSTVLYWLENRTIYIKGSTKCNIFALNILYKAGFKTPATNALSRDLFNTNLFNDILPIVKVRKPEDLRKGDLIIWKSHVILFEEIEYSDEEIYAKAIWAGTRKRDNGKNIKNNVIYGKYPLKGNFIVRRPELR